MKSDEYMIQHTYITSKTSLPLFTEQYRYELHPKKEPHSHDFFEIGMLLSGYAKHHTEQGCTQLSQGSIYLIPLGCSHALESETPFVIQNLYLLPSVLFQHISFQDVSTFLHDFLLFCSDSEQKQILHLNFTKEHHTAVQSLLSLYETTSLTTALQENFCYHCLVNILLILCDSFNTKYPEYFLRKDPRIYEILSMIQENLLLPTGEIVQCIANRLRLHPQYLNKLIKKELRTTLSSLILNTKIEKSCELLLKRGTITEVANTLAFYDHSHFHKYFVKRLGVTPSQYQQKNKHLLTMPLSQENAVTSY